MKEKQSTERYPVPIRIYWKSVSGEHNLHKINLSDVILDDYDFKIRKMDCKTHEFIKTV